MTKEAGWKVKKSEVINGEHLVTVELISKDAFQYDELLHTELHSEKINHTHHYAVTTDLLTFDHEPTSSEIEEVVINRGFNPVLECNSSELEVDSNNNTIRKTDPIRIITEGEEDVFEYNSRVHPVEFAKIFNMLPISVESIPTSISLKGDWIYLYYVSEDSHPPTQFFTEDFLLYSVRVHKDTGEIKRKGYVKVVSLEESLTSTLEGFNNVDNIIGTGVFLDEPKVTIYHTKEGEEADPLTPTDTPYYGTTWENGKIVKERKYTK